MNKDRDWKKVFHKKFVQHHYGADDFYNFHGYGSKEVDLVIAFIEKEKEISFNQGYESKMSKYHKEYYKKNKEKMNKQSREYYQKNKDSLRLKRKLKLWEESIKFKKTK